MSDVLTIPESIAPIQEAAPAPIPAAPPEPPPPYEELASRFRPIFQRIAQTAVQAEQKRELRYDAVAWLREAGFGAVRIPRRYGGGGATLPQFFRLLLELAEADSNVSHLFRGHFAFLEARMNRPDPGVHEFWFPKVVQGDVIGYAMAERNEGTGPTVTLTQEGEDFYLDGTKYYSTGTIYADWIVVSARDGEKRASVFVSATAPGVTRIDDWDGFGQRLTGSGTTRFERVKLAPEQVLRRFNRPGAWADVGPTAAETPAAPEAPAGASAPVPDGDRPADGPSSPQGDITADGERPDPVERMAHSYGKSFLQLVLLTSIAGAGRAAFRDGVDFVQKKTRMYGVPGVSSPREDPLVQRVIGRVASLSYAADSIVDNLAHALEEVYQANQAGTATDALYHATEIKAFQAQQVVIDLVLQLCSLVFEVGGASATSESRRFDRHWRNARTAASHNPAIVRERAIGDFYLNGVRPRRRRQPEGEGTPAAAADPAGAQAAATPAPATAGVHTP